MIFSRDFEERSDDHQKGEPPIFSRIFSHDYQYDFKIGLKIDIENLTENSEGNSFGRGASLKIFTNNLD